VPAGDQFDADARRYSTTFMTATVVLAIADAGDDGLELVRQRATDWLLAQAGPQWTFNYWARESAEAKALPYPDDWDDISCAMAAIMRVRPEAVTGEVMAQVVTALTSSEVQEGGPYRTWLVAPDADAAWQDVDVAVNSNIAYMLSLQDVELPSLAGLVEARVREGALRSRYYPSEVTPVYFASRWYRGGSRERLLGLLYPLLNEENDALTSALAVTAALNLGATPQAVEATVERMRNRPLAELTRAEAFCFDPEIEGQAYVAGAGALTAAFCLEALTKYEEAYQLLTHDVSKTDRVAERIHDQVVERVTGRFNKLPVDLRNAAETMTSQVLTGDPAKQITLLPYLFRKSLGRAHIRDERVVELGTMSLYGWIAYTIYDDFLDDEGRPPMLPLANVALRELVLAVERDPAGPEFAGLAGQVLDQMEAANSWEVNHCRVQEQKELLMVTAPDFGDLSALANRSMGHALGCVAMAMELGCAADSTEVRALLAFFRHFLIARQLNDEAHDWKEDLQRGQINAVGAVLLSQIERGDDLEDLYSRMEQRFWERTILDVCDLIEAELAAAQQALTECGLVADRQALGALLRPIERSTREARVQQQQTLDFLRAYGREEQSG